MENMLSFVLLITLATFPFWHAVIAEEVQINTQLPVAIVSDRFLSISMDPEDLFNNVPLPDESATMARALAPMFIQVAGPSTQLLAEAEAAGNLSDRNWRAASAWAERVGAAVIAALPAGRKVSGVWDSTPALAILANAHSARAPLLFQLGYDASELGEGGEAGRDLARLRQIIDSFPGYRGAPLLPPGLHATNSVFLKRLLSAAPNALPVMPIHVNLTGMDAEAASDAMGSAVSALDDYLSDVEPLALSSSKRPIWIGDVSRSKGKWKDAISWLTKLGIAARLGARVFLSRPLISVIQRPSPEFWVAAVYRSVVGSRVLETRVEPPRPGLRLFAHCARSNPPIHSLLDPAWKYEKGALTMFGINTGPRSTVLNLRAIGVRDEPVHLYLLTHPDGQKETLFNGERLELSPEGRLPLVSPEVRTSSKGLNIPAGAVFFAVFPESRPLACAPGTPLAPASLTVPVRQLARTLISSRSAQAPPQPTRFVTYDRSQGESSPLDSMDLSSRVMREFSRTVSRLALLAAPREAPRSRRHTSFAALHDAAMSALGADPYQPLRRMRRQATPENPPEGYKMLHDFIAEHSKDGKVPLEPLDDFIKDMSNVKVAVKDYENTERIKRGSQDGAVLFPSMPFEMQASNNPYASQSEPPYRQSDAQQDAQYNQEEKPYSQLEGPYYMQNDDPNIPREVPSDTQLNGYADEREIGRRDTRAQAKSAEDYNRIVTNPEQQEAIRHFVSRAQDVLERRQQPAPETLEVPSVDDSVIQKAAEEQIKTNKWGSTGIPYVDQWLASNAMDLNDLPSLDDLMAHSMDLTTLDQFTNLPQPEIVSLEDMMSKNAEALTALENLLNSQATQLSVNSVSNSATKRQANLNGFPDLQLLAWPQVMEDKRLRIEEMGKQLSGIQEMLTQTMRNMGPNLDSQLPQISGDLQDRMTSFISSFNALTLPGANRNTRNVQAKSQGNSDGEQEESTSSRIRREVPNQFHARVNSHEQKSLKRRIRRQAMTTDLTSLQNHETEALKKRVRRQASGSHSLKYNGGIVQPGISTANEQLEPKNSRAKRQAISPNALNAHYSLTSQTEGIAAPKPEGPLNRRVRRQISYRPDNFDNWDDFGAGELVSRFPREDNLNSANGPYYDTTDTARFEGLVNQVLNLVSGGRRLDLLDGVLSRRRRSTDNYIPASSGDHKHDPIREYVAGANKDADLKTLAEEYTRLKNNETRELDDTSVSGPVEDDEHWLVGTERVSPPVDISRKQAREKNRTRNQLPIQGVMATLLERLTHLLTLLKSLTQQS